MADILSRPNDNTMGNVYKLPQPEVAAIHETSTADESFPSFETVDPIALAKSQLECPEVVTYRAGQHLRMSICLKWNLPLATS